MKNSIFSLSICFVMGISFNAYSQQQGTRVIKVIRKKELILFHFPKEVSVNSGDYLTLVLGGGSECEIEVKKVKGSKALASVSDCPRAAKKGQIVWLSKADEVSDEEEETKKVNYSVYKFNLERHELSTRIPSDQKLGAGTEFNVFSSDNQFCQIIITRIQGPVATGSTKGCKFEFALRVGLRMELKRGKFWEKDAAKQTKTMKKKGRKSKVEDFYITIGLAIPSISYSNALDKENADGLAANPNVSHLAINIDTGFYVPLSSRPAFMLGGAINITRDNYATDDVNYTILQVSFGPSAYYYFGDRGAGEGFFLRGDVGLAYFSQTEVQNSGSFQNTSQSTPTKMGFGLIGGAGYSHPFWRGTRLTGQLTLSMKSMSDSQTMVTTFGVGLIY